MLLVPKGNSIGGSDMTMKLKLILGFFFLEKKKKKKTYPFEFKGLSICWVILYVNDNMMGH